MAYTIKNADGTTLVIVPDRKIDQATSSLTLVGKNWAGYGEYLNNNLVKLLTNESGTAPPSNPLTGQLWYDTVLKRLKVFDNQFKVISGSIVDDQPVDTITDKVVGDTYWDRTEELFYVFDGTDWKQVAPEFPSYARESGFRLPNPVQGQYILVDDQDENRDAILIKNFGKLLGFLASDAFYINTSTQFNYITTVTTATVEGLNIMGDIKATGSLHMGKKTITTASDPGKKGEMCYDSSHLYICVENNTWKRVAISSW
jgi:hypothetical protein